MTTDNDIIKALECCNVETDCKRCPLYKERSANCIDIACKNALDLITRQQAEIENLKVENQSLRGAANSLKMHYEEAQAEIERLQNILLAFMSALGKVENVEDIESIPQIPIMWELNKQFRAEIESEAVKEFCEKRGIKYVEDDV